MTPMPIERIVLNVRNPERSADFYARYLGAEQVPGSTPESVSVDAVTALIDFRRVESSVVSSWRADDLQRGFRHIGFKVSSVDGLIDPLRTAGVTFHLDPLEAEGGVRIAFFFDPDGTLLEFVERDLQYTIVTDADGVAAERSLGIPDRPRFDHIAITVSELAETERFYSHFGFTNIGRIEQPHDPRGFHIDYLRGGDTAVEVFTYDIGTEARDIQVDAPGFASAQVSAGTTSAAGQLVDPGGVLLVVA
jgi:catechol 2,3-dioxygenase-like lactoylglutathione lyase family enzyme